MSQEGKYFCGCPGCSNYLDLTDSYVCYSCEGMNNSVAGLPEDFWDVLERDGQYIWPDGSITPEP